ncbi:hypothetical protein ACFLRF_04845, partial [Candidatus Altiarchaeota archaeon]
REGNKGGRQTSINTLTRAVTEQAASDLPGAERSVNEAAPVLLDVLSADYGGVDKHHAKLDRAAAFTAFEEWSRKMPDATVTALIRAGNIKDDEMLAPDPVKGPAAVRVIDHIGSHWPTIPGAVAKNLIMDDDLSTIALQSLRTLGNDAIRPVIDDAMKAPDEGHLLAYGFGLAIMGSKALDSLFEYMDDHPDKAVQMRGLALVAAPLMTIAGGAENQTEKSHLAGLEGMLRESPKFARIMTRSLSSGDGDIMRQAEEIKKMMEKV